MKNTVLTPEEENARNEAFYNRKLSVAEVIGSVAVIILFCVAMFLGCFAFD